MAWGVRWGRKASSCRGGYPSADSLRVPGGGGRGGRHRTSLRTETPGPPDWVWNLSKESANLSASRHQSEATVNTMCDPVIGISFFVSGLALGFCVAWIWRICREPTYLETLWRAEPGEGITLEPGETVVIEIPLEGPKQEKP